MILGKEELSQKEVYLLEFLADYSYISIHQAGLLCGTEKTAYRLINKLKKKQLMIKTKQGTGRPIKYNGENPEDHRQKILVGRLMRNLRKLNTLVAKNDAQDLVKQIQNDILTICPEILKYKQKEEVMSKNLYILSESGKKYLNELGIKVRQINYNPDFVLRLTYQSAIACLLKGVGVEVIQRRYMANNFCPPFFLASRVAKEIKSDIGSATRVLGILFTERSAYAIYRDEDKPRRYILQDERSLFNANVIQDLSNVDQCIIITSNRIQLEKQLREETDYVNEGYRSIHIIENNNIGLIIFRAIAKYDNWLIKILNHLFDGYLIADFMKGADCLYCDKKVFVMVSNDFSRRRRLDSFLLSGIGYMNVILICLESQIAYYSDQSLFPGAEVIAINDEEFINLINFGGN